MSSRNSSGRNNGPRAKPYNLRTPDDVGDQTVPADSGPGMVVPLSPANVTGIRAGQILSDCAHSELPELQRRLRREGVTLGELFCFISGLYFRGKLAYARAFARRPMRREFPVVHRADRSSNSQVFELWRFERAPWMLRHSGTLLLLCS
jgi:hypothetical protein